MADLARCIYIATERLKVAVQPSIAAWDTKAHGIGGRYHLRACVFNAVHTTSGECVVSNPLRPTSAGIDSVSNIYAGNNCNSHDLSQRKLRSLRASCLSSAARRRSNDHEFDTYGGERFILPCPITKTLRRMKLCGLKHPLLTQVRYKYGKLTARLGLYPTMTFANSIHIDRHASQDPVRMR